MLDQQHARSILRVPRAEAVVVHEDGLHPTVIRAAQPARLVVVRALLAVAR